MRPPDAGSENEFRRINEATRFILIGPGLSSREAATQLRDPAFVFKGLL